MGFRTVVVNNRCKLELKMNYLVCRGEETKRVFINEISTLIIATTAVAITGSLLSELVKNRVKVIFCDEKHNPQMELLPYYDSYNSSKKIYNQINWNELSKQMVWTSIVRQKIIMQGKLLDKFGFTLQAQELFDYAEQVELNDATNREGHSAKLYFATLFGKGWRRDGGDFRSKALNYKL
ncbi:MAG: type II CRISPR-associated endonuclease Cas1 [Clostridia bacterium]|nr:type II CRISPR-associated endonuclease Cas1 [Clostridia bacterium]MBQ9793267.1 type II CRISPR-associated endonuclease Cas1 [Clostridia bacterium]